MFLEFLKLRNFRSFAQAEVFFQLDSGYVPNSSSDAERFEQPNRKWTLFLGENGTGKTNLLRAIAMIMGGKESLFEFLGPEPDQWIRYGCRICEIEAGYTNSENELRTVKLRIERGDSRSAILDRNGESLEALDRALDYTSRSYFLLGYGVGRQLNPSNEGVTWRHSSRFSRRFNRVGTLFEAGAKLCPLESWAMDLDYREGGSSFAVIKEALGEFLGEGVSFERIDKAAGRLMFRTEDGVVPLAALSDGYKNVAAWIGDLLYHITETFDDYRDPLSTRGVLLIDEIDLHLHPIWQKRLLDFLDKRLPNFQIIATSHSPITAQQAHRGTLHLCERTRGAVQIRPFIPDPQKLLLHQLVTSDAFGLSSDEPLAMDRMKNEYRQLRDKQNKTTAEKRRLKELSEEISEVPAERSNSDGVEKLAAMLERFQSQQSGD